MRGMGRCRGNLSLGEEAKRWFFLQLERKAKRWLKQRDIVSATSAPAQHSLPFIGSKSISPNHRVREIKNTQSRAYCRMLAA
jgi:hypothetical protein